MTIFKNNNESEPFKKFRDLYKDAESLGQDNIEAILICSYSKQDEEVDARFVNLKSLDNNKFIFYSNYESPKSKQFQSHTQISAVIFWGKSNVQIRMKANITKISEIESNNYFLSRDKKKNALAIISRQSEIIGSYNEICNLYESKLSNEDQLNIRPDYWGGYAFVPYYFEFWKGHESRLNYRKAYYLKDSEWKSNTLQP